MEGRRCLGSLYGYGLQEASGTSCKLLCIALGLADAYVLSDGTTFTWDTCGHPALAWGGGMVEVEGSLWLCCVGRDKNTHLSHLGLFSLPLPLPQEDSHPVL